MGQQGKRRQHGGGKEGKPQRQRFKRSQLEDAEVKRLDAIIKEGAPARGTNPLALASSGATAGESYAAATSFEELPLSRHTKEGLAAKKFVQLTAIQRAALPHALAGRDILGAAKTGSGKTLAFLVPVRRNDDVEQHALVMLVMASGDGCGRRGWRRACTQVVEKLYRERWTRLDGLGALVLTPTRELALQIFQELRKVREAGAPSPGVGPHCCAAAR